MDDLYIHNPSHRLLPTLIELLMSNNLLREVFPSFIKSSKLNYCFLKMMQRRRRRNMKMIQRRRKRKNMKMIQRRKRKRKNMKMQKKSN